MRRIGRHTCHRLANGTTWLAVLLMLALTGCAGHHRTANATATGVQLSHANYRLIKAGAQGSSSGFRLLELIPVTAPSVADAKSALYDSIGASLEGRAVALTNLSEDSYTVHFLLFAVPRVRVSADVIEFTDTSAAGSSSQLKALDPNAPVPCREVGDQLVCDVPGG